MATKRRVKAGTSKAAAVQRRIKFIAAYISNGNNATRAAIAAGYSPKSAERQGLRLTRDVRIRRFLAEAAEKSAKIAGLTIERTLQEVARLAYSDPRRLYDARGNLIPVHQLDDDAAATVASVEVDEIKVEGGVVSHTKKVKVWDKNAALEKAMKHHGLYEEDNSQRGESITLKVVFGKDE